MISKENRFTEIKVSCIIIWCICRGIINMSLWFYPLNCCGGVKMLKELRLKGVLVLFFVALLTSCGTASEDKHLWAL